MPAQAKNKTNILITSAGRRGYLIRYFKEALGNKGKVFAADCSRYSPAIYDADKYFIVPEVLHKDYVKNLLDICIKNKIRGIFSVHDLELPILAKNKKIFSQKNIEVIVSNPEVIDICYDKYKTFLFLKRNGFMTPKTFISVHEALKEIKKKTLSFPLLIKAKKGCASMGIKKVYNAKQLQNEFNRKTDIIQEFIVGEEYGIDFFNNKDGMPIAIFIKKKIQMRSGETDKALTVYDKNLIEIVKKLGKKLGSYGPTDADVLKQGSRYLFIDINPRFGGGYPLARAAGADFPAKIISLVNKENLKPDYKRYPANILMMKQHEIVIKKMK